MAEVDEMLRRYCRLPPYQDVSGNGDGVGSAMK